MTTEIDDDRAFPEEEDRYGPGATARYQGTEAPLEPGTTRELAYAFIKDCGMDATPDAVGQLTEVFLPCLRIMCERGYDPNGANWREGGWRSQLVDTRKKFKRLWWHAWIKGVFVPDHGYDMINYVAFYQRLGLQGKPWGDWGEPEQKEQ